eukprot:951015-Pyramimonas_sp.AAC.1
MRISYGGRRVGWLHSPVVGTRDAPVVNGAEGERTRAVRAFVPDATRLALRVPEEDPRLAKELKWLHRVRLYLGGELDGVPEVLQLGLNLERAAQAVVAPVLLRAFPDD